MHRDSQFGLSSSRPPAHENADQYVGTCRIVGCDTDAAANPLLAVASNDSTPGEIQARTNCGRLLSAAPGQLVFPVLIGGIAHDQEAATAQRERHGLQLRTSRWFSCLGESIAVTQLKIARGAQ